MKVFCINLRLELTSQNFLYSITEEIELRPLNLNCYLHTTLFQGLTNSWQRLSEWLTSDNCILQTKNEILSLKNWDNHIKKLGRIYFVNYNNDFQSICLPYENSNYIKFLSKTLYTELKANNLLIDLSQIDNTSKLESNYRYAIDYQYMALTGNVFPHTTLGFSSRKTNSKMKLFIDDEVKIHHDAILISSLNKYCMTANEMNYKILSL